MIVSQFDNRCASLGRRLEWNLKDGKCDSMITL